MKTLHFQVGLAQHISVFFAPLQAGKRAKSFNVANSHLHVFRCVVVDHETVFDEQSLVGM